MKENYRKTKRWGALLTALVCTGAMAKDLTNDKYEQTFKEYESYKNVANFATDDLIQGLKPDKSGGLYKRGQYITGSSACDAVSNTDPGKATYAVKQGWYKLPAYLIYTLPHPSDIQEIRLTGILSSGKDTPKIPQKVSSTYGDIVLGIKRQTNPGGKPPIRPAENAIEVMYEGETFWTSIVDGIVRSPRRTGDKGFWQGVWKFKPKTLKNVIRIKFTLGPVSVWSSYGASTRLIEADVIGSKSTEKLQSLYKHVPAVTPEISVTGYVFPTNQNGLIFAWSGSGIEFKMKSKTCRLRFQTASPKSQYWIKVDGGEWTVYPTTSIIDISSALKSTKDNLHTIKVVKKTEQPSGVNTFIGVDIDKDGKILPNEKSIAQKRRILFLGDSITVGMQSPKRGQTDIMSSYAWMVGQKFNADIRIVGVSGVGVFKGWRNIRFIDYWKSVSIKEKTHKALWEPDLIIFNLGTNDASRGVKGDDFKKAMKTLVSFLNNTYTQANILVMVPWTYSCYKKELKAVVDELSQDSKGEISLVMTDKKTWMIKGGMSDNTHPNFKGHCVAAEKLIPVIGKTMKWKY